jgi:hypothetical protein
MFDWRMFWRGFLGTLAISAAVATIMLLLVLAHMLIGSVGVGIFTALLVALLVGFVWGVG